MTTETNNKEQATTKDWLLLGGSVAACFAAIALQIHIENSDDYILDAQKHLDQVTACHQQAKTEPSLQAYKKAYIACIHQPL